MELKKGFYGMEITLFSVMDDFGPDDGRFWGEWTVYFASDKLAKTEYIVPKNDEAKAAELVRKVAKMKSCAREGVELIDEEASVLRNGTAVFHYYWAWSREIPNYEWAAYYEEEEAEEE